MGLPSAVAAAPIDTAPTGRSVATAFETGLDSGWSRARAGRPAIGYAWTRAGALRRAARRRTGRRAAATGGASSGVTHPPDG